MVARSKLIGRQKTKTKQVLCAVLHERFERVEMATPFSEVRAREISRLYLTPGKEYEISKLS